MLDTAGSAAVPVARCKNLRRGSLIFEVSNLCRQLLTTARLSSFEAAVLIEWIRALRRRPEFAALCAHTAAMPPRLAPRDELFPPRS